MTLGRSSAATGAAVTGVGGAAWMVVATVVVAAESPGYSHRVQYISELGARGAPHGEIMSLAGFLPTGVLLVAFAWLAARAVPRGAASAIGFVGLGVYALGYVAAAFFRCDPGCDLDDPSVAQLVHTAVGGIGYLLGPIALVVLGVAARRWPGAGHLVPLGIGGGVLALAALPLTAPGTGWTGLAQRVLEACHLVWIVACALWLGSHRDAST